MYILHSRGCVEIGRSRSACDRVVMTNRRVGGCNPSLRTHAHATHVLVRTRTPFYRPPNVFAIFMENISNKALSIYRQLACDVSRDKFLIFAAPKKKKKKCRLTHSLPTSASSLTLPVLSLLPAVSVVLKERRSKDSVTLAWQGPQRPKGVIVEYEVIYYEKVRENSFLEGCPYLCTFAIGISTELYFFPILVNIHTSIHPFSVPL